MDARETSRWSASFVVSVAAHAALAVLVAGTAIVKLDVVPITIDLASLDVSNRMAGPGDTAPELRLAAPSPPPPVPLPREPAQEETPPERAVQPPEPAVRLAPVAKPKTQPDAAAKKPAPSSAPSPAESNATGDGRAAGATSPDGTAVRSTAPAWAPTARVRYEQVLFAWMDRHKDYPMIAQRRRLEGEGKVRLRIDRDGRVLERAMVESTGERMLDQAALDTVRRANPFPAVPSEYPGETLEITVPINFFLP